MDWKRRWAVVAALAVAGSACAGAPPARKGVATDKSVVNANKVGRNTKAGDGDSKSTVDPGKFDDEDLKGIDPGKVDGMLIRERTWTKDDGTAVKERTYLKADGSEVKVLNLKKPDGTEQTVVQP